MHPCLKVLQEAISETWDAIGHDILACDGELTHREIVDIVMGSDYISEHSPENAQVAKDVWNHMKVVAGSREVALDLLADSFEFHFA